MSTCPVPAMEVRLLRWVCNSLLLVGGKTASHGLAFFFDQLTQWFGYLGKVFDEPPVI